MGAAEVVENQTSHPAAQLVVNQQAISQPVINQTNHPAAEVVENQTSHPAAEVAVNQLVVNQQAVSQQETNPLSAVMTENGPNVKNQLPSKMDVSSVKRINACSNVTKVTKVMAVVKQNASRVKTEKLSLSIRHSEHVIHAQKMVAQNHQNHPVVSQLAVNQLAVNQLVINQLVKSHQQASARTSLLCSGKTLSLLLNVLKMTLVKWPVM